MDRQPLILSLLWLAACEEDLGDQDAFDQPISAAVLSPDQGGPFTEPVGFVASARSGAIVPLDLKHATFLSDQPAAPFLPPRQVATGDERQLGDMAVFGTEDGAIELYVLDARTGSLLSAPYLLGADPDPIVPTPTATEASFTDADGSGESPTLGEIELRNGYTTTETWTVLRGEDAWWVTGSRSGQQTRRPESGDAYCTDRRELCFTLEGEATEGDTFELSTDVGLVEHDLGGQPLGMIRAGDLLVIGVWDAEAATGEIVLFDPATDTVAARFAPAQGAQPWRFTASPDGDVIYAGDAQNPAIYVLTVDAADPAASALSTLSTDAPVSALARVDGEDYTHLFVGLSELNRVDVYDLVAGAWKDVNPYDAAVQGVEVHHAIIGLAASPEPVRLQTETAWEARYEDHVVTMTTSYGALMMFEGSTGCLATDVSGPTLALSDGYADLQFVDQLPGSTPYLLEDDATGNEIQVNPCGGVNRDQSWLAVYDETVGAWEVEANLDGPQTGLAYEDSRYVSDAGELSFTILAGAAPSSDGDAFIFVVDDAVLRVTGTQTASGSTDAFTLPAAPVIFQWESGNTGGGWDPLDRRTYALVPVTGSDKVVRVRLSTWDVEVGWN